MCSESNHLSPNDFWWAYGILRILKIYTTYCLMNHHHPCMHEECFKQFHQKVSLAIVCKYNKDEMLLYSVYTGQTMGPTLLKNQRRGSPKEICNSLHACNGIPCPKHYMPIRKFETIFMSMHCTSFLIVIHALQVLRNTTMMQKNIYTSLAIDGMHQLTL